MSALPADAGGQAGRRLAAGAMPVFTLSADAQASQAAQQAETEGQIASVEGQAASATEENPAAEQAVERSSRRRVTPTVEQTASEPLQHQQDVDQTDTSERTVAKTDTAHTAAAKARPVHVTRPAEARPVPPAAPRQPTPSTVAIYSQPSDTVAVASDRSAADTGKPNEPPRFHTTRIRNSSGQSVLIYNGPETDTTADTAAGRAQPVAVSGRWWLVVGADDGRISGRCRPDRSSVWIGRQWFATIGAGGPARGSRTSNRVPRSGADLKPIVP